MVAADLERQKSGKARLYWIVFGPLLIVVGFLPVRVISIPNWWINPVLYGVLTLGCLLAVVRFVRRHPWKRVIVLVMVACMLLSGLNALISLTEISRCWVEDVRWTQEILCDGGGRYQQIEDLGIGMQGYCYYCLWYPGVR